MALIWNECQLLPANPNVSIFLYWVKSVKTRRYTTLNFKRKYTLWVSVGKYSKPTACWTHERVCGIARWSSTPNKSGSKVLNQSLKVCTLSASNTEVNDRNWFLWTLWHNIPTNFFPRTLKPSGCPSKLLGSSSGYILSTHWETKCIL